LLAVYLPVENRVGFARSLRKNASWILFFRVRGDAETPGVALLPSVIYCVADSFGNKCRDFLLLDRVERGTRNQIKQSRINE